MGRSLFGAYWLLASVCEQGGDADANRWGSKAYDIFERMKRSGLQVTEYDDQILQGYVLGSVGSPNCPA